jgi:hypothetical protein
VAVALFHSSARASPWQFLLAVVSFLVVSVSTSIGPAAAATPALVLNPGQVVEAGTEATSHGTAPSDGRLRGDDFTAVVSEVAWPQSAPSASGLDYVAGSRHRLVAFTVSVTQPTDDSGLLNAPTAVTASLKVGAVSAPVSLTRISQQIAGGTSGRAETNGTDSFVASVPARSHAVDLVLTEAGFGQSLNLWTLERVPPSPTVLYRDANSSSVTGTPGAPFHLAFTNPADGFSSSDNASVSSAELTYFAPDGSGTTPGDPAQAYLVANLQSSYPSVPYGRPNSGHFFSSFTPLPGNRLTFTPTGGNAVSATANTTAFSSTNAASDDDGTFDSLYWFAVPATTTGGTLSVTAGPASGTEYTGFTGSGTTVPVDVTAAASTTISFPAVPSAPRAQGTPPWVGAPLPATGLAAAPSTGSSSGSGSGRGNSPGGGFPIWAAVLALVVVAGVVVLVQRRRRRGALAGAAVSAPTSEPSPAPPEHNVEKIEPMAPSIQPVMASAPPPAPPPSVRPQSPRGTALEINVLGPLDLGDLCTDDVSRVVVELLVYLACHDHRHLRVGQIQIGLRPLSSGRPEIAEKTLRNYLSQLRQWIGAEHLPESSAKEGYLLHDVEVDWAAFLRLSRQADASGGADAIALRTEALTLVRGRPFEDALGDGFEWVEAEHLDSQMAGVIATCAVRLASDHLEAKDYAAAEQAAWAARRGAPEDSGPWLAGARAIWAQGDRSALRRWMTDASRHLDPEDIARIERSLPAAHDSSST